MDTPERQFAEKMLAEGWDVTKRGWPDFICRRNGELMAVEVKGPHDGLSRQQYETIADLRRAGIPTYVWGPSEGFTEVGPPVGESVFSLRATIAQLRQILADLKVPPPPKPVPQGVIAWTYQEHDAESLEWIKQECLRTHTNHLDYGWGITGTLCGDLALLIRHHTVYEIVRMKQLRNLGKTRRTLDNIRAKMFTFQHDRLHAGLQPAQRCTSCSSQQAA